MGGELREPAAPPKSPDFLRLLSFFRPMVRLSGPWRVRYRVTATSSLRIKRFKRSKAGTRSDGSGGNLCTTLLTTQIRYPDSRRHVLLDTDCATAVAGGP